MNFFKKLFGKKTEGAPPENDVLTNAGADEIEENIISARDFQYSQNIYSRNLFGVLTYEIETISLVDNIRQSKLYVCEFIEINGGRLALGVRTKRGDDFFLRPNGELFLSYSMHGESFFVEAKIIKVTKTDKKVINVDNNTLGISDKDEHDVSGQGWIHCIVEMILCAEPVRHHRKHGRITTEWNVYYRVQPNGPDGAAGDNESSNYSVTKTIDISEGGFKSIVEKQLTENTLIECIVEVDNQRKSEGALIGRIIRCVPMADSVELFEMTVQFVEIDESVREFIVNCIGEINPWPVDAEAKITISKDGLEAFIELSPPRNNGSDLSYEALCARLTGEGVIFGIDNDLLKSLSEKPHYNLESVIARGIPPTHGDDAILTYHVDINPVLAPREYENGMVDFKDIGLIQPVKKDDVLAEKTLLSEGTPGTCVTGKIHEAIPGKDEKLPTGANTVVNENGTALLAGIDGCVSIINGKINVLKTYTIEGDVNYETGNINHNGIVIIKGDVRRGFAVNTTGDIIINGTVESASITAGGSLVVQGGCVGEESVIEIGGNLACKFINNGTFNIRGDLKTTYIINSTIKCGGSVDLAGNGVIRNSRITARATVSAKCIGSERAAADKTVIEVGNDPELLNRFVSVSREIIQLEKDIESVETIIRTLTKMKYNAGLTPEKSEMLDKSKESIKHFIAEHKARTEEYGNLKGQINELGYGSISARDTAYEGLRIIIGSCTLVLKDAIKAVKFYRNNDEIALSSLR